MYRVFGSTILGLVFVISKLMVQNAQVNFCHNYLCFLGASTLTLREIQNELNEMEAARWYQLGIQLGVPIAILSTIESDHPHDTQRRMTEVINWWFRNTPERSWAELAEAVEMMGGYAVLAERLRQRMSQG